MAQLVKIKGLKGKQNKKKWAKNIDVSLLLQAKAKDHDELIRSKYTSNLQIKDDNENTRKPLDPNRFKNQYTILPKKKYDNTIRRELNLNEVQDAWNAENIPKKQRKQLEIPSVIAPESGHSYNAREQDIQKLKERVIDYQRQTYTQKVRKNVVTELPQINIRFRNKKKRAAFLATRQRKEQKEFKQQLHSMKKIRKALQEREDEIQEKIKQKKIKKAKEQYLDSTGRVKKGKKLGKKYYKYKQYIPSEGERVQKLSKISLSNELVRERFDTIYRRGIFQPRNIKVNSNRKKHIKVKERGFNQQ